MGYDSDAKLFFGVQVTFDQLIQLCRFADTRLALCALSLWPDNASDMIAHFTVEKSLEAWQQSIVVPEDAIPKYEPDESWLEFTGEDDDDDEEENKKLEEKEKLEFVEKEKAKYVEKLQKQLLRSYEGPCGQAYKKLLKTDYAPLQCGYANPDVSMDIGREEWNYFIHFPIRKSKKRKGLSGSQQESSSFTASSLVQFFRNINIEPWKKLCRDFGWKYDEPLLDACSHVG